MSYRNAKVLICSQFLGYILIFLLCSIPLGMLAAQQATETSPPSYHNIVTFGRGRITQALWSPIEDVFAVSSSRGVYLYSANLEEIAHLTDDNTFALAWSADGTKLASASEGNLISIWNVETAELLRQINTSNITGQIHHLDWSPDDVLLAGGGWSGAGIWDVNSSELLHLFPFDESNAVRVAWNADSTVLAVASARSVIAYNVETGDPTFTLDNVGSLPFVAWSPDNRYIATASGNFLSPPETNSLKVWDATSANLLIAIQAGYVGSLAWSSDGTLLSTTSVDDIGYLIYPVFFWNPYTGELIDGLPNQHLGAIHSADWNKETDQFLTASEDNTLRIWDLPLDGLQTGALLQGYMSSITSLDWSPEGNRIVSGSNDGGIRIWNTATGDPIATMQSDVRDVWSVSWDPNGSRLAVGDGQTAVDIWDVETREIVSSFTGHNDSVNPIWRRGVASTAWSPDGRLLASGGYDGKVVVWNADTGRLLKELRARGAPVLTVSWHPDGQTLLAADGDATLWDVTNGHILQTYECQLGSHPNAYISDAMFSPDGSFVAGVADNQFVCIWDTSSGRLLNTILLEADVYKVVWNPVEMQIAIIQSEELYASTRRVSLWDPLTGEAFSVIDGQPDAQSLAWSPDGTRLATGGRDGTIRIWGIP